MIIYYIIFMMLVLEKRGKLKYLGPFVEPHQTLEERVATGNTTD